jgi:predicted outer membrane repeat protein
MTRSWPRWWRNAKPRTAHRDLPVRSRLRVECLEDRAMPSTYTVTTRLDVVDAADGLLSLREAITRANNHAGADTVVLPSGVCRISLAGAGEDANATGDFDVTGTLTIRGGGAGASIVDAQQLDRVFDAIGTAPSSIRLILQSLTVRTGSVTGDGGGVRGNNADLTVRDCVVAGNRASGSGGGIAQVAGNVGVVRSAVNRNAAGTGGGGVFSSGGGSVFSAASSTFHRNSAGDLGGGIFANTATLTNSTVSSNSAVTNGGGILAVTATLTNCTVGGNSAATNGGGIRATTAAILANCTVGGNTATNGGGVHANTATLTNSTVSDNSASSAGGGVNAGTATITNSTVSGNRAGTQGGGVFAVAAALLNVTVVENLAHTGGGVFHNPGGTFSARNTLVALNLVDFTGTNPDMAGAFTSGGRNLIGNGTGGTGFTDAVNGDMVGTAANPIDPKIGALADNGGRTRTHALLAGSPAIDRGDNAGVPANDQRGGGFPRRKNGDGKGAAVVDIGAYEV